MFAFFDRDYAYFLNMFFFSFETLILSAFNSPSEEVKTAAAQALGALGVGNLDKYLPFILAELEAQPKRQYLLLHALKEVD